MKKIRYIPRGGALVSITAKTFQSRHLLRPSTEAKDVTIGVLARSARRTGVRICAVAVLSNHVHLLIWVEDAAKMAEFMRYFKTNVAREVNRLVDWSGSLWENKPYDDTLVSDEETAQVDRLAYVLSQSVKENLVERAVEWPGVHCAAAFATGRSLKGYWIDRTGYTRARQRGEDVAIDDFTEPEELELWPIPCWEHLSEEDYRAAVVTMLTKVETDAAALRGEDGVLGVEAILAQDPHARPEDVENTPPPAVHAATREVREAMKQTYRLFVMAYRVAAKRLREGLHPVDFPPGCFPPGLPFVPFPDTDRAGPASAG